MEAQSLASSLVIRHASNHAGHRPQTPMRDPSSDAGPILEDTGSRHADWGLIAISIRAPTQKRAIRLTPASSVHNSSLSIGEKRAQTRAANPTSLNRICGKRGLLMPSSTI